MTSPSGLMLGGNIFGHFTDFDQTQRIINGAREFNIKAIDTADVYSEGLSEKLIGQCLKNDRADWFVASKVGLKSHESPAGLGKKDNIFNKAEGSLRRLQTDYLDLYQMHHFDPITPLEETIEAFQQLIEQGKIRAAGISNYEISQLQKLKGYSPHCFGFHQASLNIASASVSKEKIKVCGEQGIKIIAYGALVRGLFHEKYLEGIIPEGSRATVSQSIKKDLSENFLYKLQQTAVIAKKYHTSLLSIALNSLKKSSSVEWTIVGCRDEMQLRNCFQGWLQEIATSCLEEVALIWEGFTF
ncbi:MAG: aldo/keto reductase [Simkaniaceae bacterium]|nr:aldo/keto reductase [Simkaniaceae bacterium]